MRFKFEVEVEVARTEGKFASRDEIAEQLREAIEGGDPGTVEGENGGQYEVIEFSVSDVSDEQDKATKTKISKTAAVTPQA